MLKWTLIIILSLTANRLSAQRVLTYNDENFIYKLERDSADMNCVVKSIAITTRRNAKKVQVIKPGDNSLTCTTPANQLFILEDANFDGHTDIRLLQFLPAGPNLPYYFWIFDPSVNKFKEDTALEAITSPAFDHKNKLITSEWQDGCCSHGSRTYRYIDRKPMLIEEKETRLDDKDNTKQITTTKRLVNGKLKLVNRTVGKAG